MKSIIKGAIGAAVVLSLWQMATAGGTYTLPTLPKGAKVYTFETQSDAFQYIGQMQMNDKITADTEIFVRPNEYTNSWQLIINDRIKSDGILIEDLMRQVSSEEPPLP